MRPRRNREISIFSMSALDLFASGLGAFLILMVILFPFYKKETDTQAKLDVAQETLANCQQTAAKNQQALSEIQSKLAAVQQTLASCQETSKAAQQSLSQCREKLKSSMLLVTLSWQAEGGVQSSDDVDMFITDPDGHKFSFEKANNPPGTHYPVQARISKDIKQTPGYEIFEDPVARPGTYDIAIQLYAKSSRGQKPLKVELKIYTSAGVNEMPNIIINPAHDAGRLIKVANVTVGRDGDVTVSSSR